LTIAGSDILSGGGMQADLATFAYYELYGFVALTSIVTVQADKFFVHPVPSEIFEEQLASLEKIDFAAIKIGLLPNRQILLTTAKFLSKQTAPIILDPVIVFKENADYRVNEIRELFIEQLIPLAKLITPNLREAEILSGIEIKNLTDMRKAAKILYQFGAKSVIIKGGNRFDKTQAIDLFYDGNRFIELSKPISAKNNNGAGCTFASSLASLIAHTISADAAFAQAKDFVYQAILAANDYGVFQNAPHPG
jgi:pyridoxine kinase